MVKFTRLHVNFKWFSISVKIFNRSTFLSLQLICCLKQNNAQNWRCSKFLDCSRERLKVHIYVLMNGTEPRSRRNWPSIHEEVVVMILGKAIAGTWLGRGWREPSRQSSGSWCTWSRSSWRIMPFGIPFLWKSANWCAWRTWTSSTTTSRPFLQMRSSNATLPTCSSRNHHS